MRPAAGLRPVLREARRLGPLTHDLSRELWFAVSAQIGVYPSRRASRKTYLPGSFECPP